MGAVLSGDLRFERPGSYGFKVTSNDAVRLEAGGVLIHQELGVHADTTSDVIDVRIDRAAWYPVTIWYFQKRGTATLIVKWAPPDSGSKLTSVRGPVLAHRK